MHIRLLLLSFFLQFFPDVIRNNHLFILQSGWLTDSSELNKLVLKNPHDTSNSVRLSESACQKSY